MLARSRLLALLLLIPLYWLAQQAIDSLVAGVSGYSAAAYTKTLYKIKDGDEWGRHLVIAERRIKRARELFPRHPQYALQALELAGLRRAATEDPQQREELFAYSEQLARAALVGAPVRSDLWAELALLLHEKEGASPGAMRAIERALYFGPREPAPLLANARVTFASHLDLSGEQRQRGWDGVMVALEVPGLAPRVMGLAREAGLGRHLATLRRERARVRAILEARARGESG